MDTVGQRRIIEILNREKLRLEQFLVDVEKQNQDWLHDIGETDFVPEFILDEVQKDIESINEFLGDGKKGFYAKVWNKEDKKMDLIIEK